ncbi:MAG: hypothetical protein K2J51_01365 [Alistipes sp.]|nr:hypothetical protein [Alistipes sp.]MDE6778111.1 hypothetical protein [Alistipes sp.]
MAEDIEFDPVTDEELRREREERELARRIRREVRRVNSGEADDDIREDEEAEREELVREQEKAAREKRRQSSWLWLVMSGTIVLRSGVGEYYRYAICIAAMFLLSIFSIFNALRLDMRFTRTERETQLLRERSIRLQERRYQRTTHSAVVEALRARGIDLYEPLTETEIIE